MLDQSFLKYLKDSLDYNWYYCSYPTVFEGYCNPNHIRFQMKQSLLVVLVVGGGIVS